LRAPSRCFAEPDRLKSTWDSAHRWMKEGAQVKIHIEFVRSAVSLYITFIVLALISYMPIESITPRPARGHIATPVIRISKVSSLLQVRSLTDDGRFNFFLLFSNLKIY